MMRLAESFQYQEPVHVLADGIYTVQLGEPFETSVGSYQVLRFPFKVVDVREECAPNYFDLFDVTDVNDNRQVEMFMKNLSKIKACFLLEGKPIPENYKNWVGHRGIVEIKKSEKGFSNVTRFERNSQYEMYKNRL